MSCLGSIIIRNSLKNRIDISINKYIVIIVRRKALRGNAPYYARDND
jgi:hypothetical protein